YEALNNTGFANSFAIDLSGLNFTSATITTVAQQPELYKCKEWDFSAQSCNGNWVKLMDLMPGKEYSIVLGPDDPGFGEFNSSSTNIEQTTSSTTPQNATQLNFTPTIPQYVLIGFAEINRNITTNDARSRLLLNGTTNIGNLTWEPTNIFSYSPFFTHKLINLNVNALQSLNVQFWGETTAANTTIRRATAVALGIKDSDAVTNESGSTFQRITPANTYHSVVNLSYTPTINQLLLVLSSAELWPNKTNESVYARLTQNNTEVAIADREGKDINDIVLFATHLIVNATANVQQNFSLQAYSEIRDDKAIRQARITIIPLNDSTFYNESRPPSSTTSATPQNKTFLFFTLDEPKEVLILGSARLNISNAAGLNSTVALLFLDEEVIGNTTVVAKDPLDDFSFITVRQTSLNAGPHSLRMTYNRQGTAGTVAMANARIAALVLPKKKYLPSNISVTKTDWPDPVNKSQNLTYQINVSSTGNGTAYNVTINDTYPLQVIYLTSQPTPLTGTNNTWNWTVLPPGTNISINITVLVLNITNGTIINNTVNISYTNETGTRINTSTTINTTIINRPPSVAQVILNTTNNLLNDTYQNLTLYIINATDVDDAVVQNITDWRVNNKSIALLNMPFETNTQSLTTGAIRDYSQYGNNGTLGGGTAANSPVWNNSGKVGGAYQFDGIDDYIQVSGLLGQPASITITAWINWAPNSQDAEGEIISLGDYVALRVSTINYPPWVGAYGFYYDGSTWQATPSSMFLNGTGWHHLAYTFDNNAKVQSIYVDGVLINYTTYSLPISYSGLGSNTIIGRHANGGTTWDFNGTIDEVLVFNRSLSAGQIWQLYVDGNKSIHSMSIASTETITGEVWQACATPNDNQQDGNTVCSNNVTILAPKVYINWTNPSTNETPIYWNTSIRFNTTWTSGTSLSGYIFSINQSGWQNSSFTTFGGLTNESWNIT
ncbi:MAG: LamG-like jellyroll fold domain-containing protein, partial [Candidatus Woesearchaeota archaeon]